MQIAILGNKRSKRDELEVQVRSCLAKRSDIEICQYGMDEPSSNPAPAGVSAAFVIMDSASDLSSLRTVSGWNNKALPLVIASDSPQYALEGIRLQVRYYIFFPLVDADVNEALRRMGLEVKDNKTNTYF